ncbi:MAG: beta-hexosaminidase [Candidatus Kapaibacterium sp.]|nr:MAG: beta-hexosaminidase [Candidatus Kapabacteria bacterium]
MAKNAQLRSSPSSKGFAQGICHKEFIRKNATKGESFVAFFLLSCIHYLGRTKKNPKKTRFYHLFTQNCMFFSRPKLAILCGCCLLTSVLDVIAQSKNSKISLLDNQSRLQSTAQTLALMPFPSEISVKEGKFRLATSSAIQIQGNPHQRLYSAASRFLRSVGNRTGIHFGQGYLTPQDTVLLPSIVVHCKRAGKVEFGENEGYTLTVTPETITIQAETDIGAIRGLSTLAQLVASDADGYYIPALAVNDKPRFPWRGLMLDVARHFFSVDVVKRQLDLLEAVKMNVLHLHLSDDQGFRLESKLFPKLHEMGSDGQYFTQEEMRGIIRYADERGIRIIPEFDLPGHSTAWYIGYPEFSSGSTATFGGPYKIDRRFGRNSPVMNPTKEETYTFLDGFFKEMCELFPDEYFHIGGDENNGKQWAANPDIQAFMKANNLPTKEALQNYFNKRLLGILTKNNKKMMGWDEIFVEGVPKSIMIQSWQGKEAMYKAARQGYTALLSHGYYIDLNQSTEFHYLNEPLPDSVKLSPAEAKLIAGGEATMWSEWVDKDILDSRIWPRTAAIAERLWSKSGQNNVADMYRRLDAISTLLEEKGSTHERNVPVLLRRLVQSPQIPFPQENDVKPLQNLIEVLETVKEYKRGQLLGQPNYSTFLPLTSIPDVVRPDSRTARHFRATMKRYLQSRTNSTLAEATDADKAVLIRHLQLWKDNHTPFVRLIETAPRLRDIEEHSLLLSMLSQVSLDALSMLENNIPATPQWKEITMLLIQRAKQPRAFTDIMIMPAVEDLVKAVSRK